ncbi:flavin monoamine oxidase family protein [Pedococcus soli]
MTSPARSTSGSGPRVIVIGAGMAGLVACLELVDLGYDPVILEGQSRVGGRILTLRDFAPGLHAEAGAMRIARVHQLTLEYCRRFGLGLRPFVMENPNALVYIAGKRWTYEQVNREPDLLGFDLHERERGRTYEDLWLEATTEIRDRYAREGPTALAGIGKEYSHDSIRDFLLRQGFSEGALELYGLMSFREANMNAAVIEQFREIVGHAFEDMQEVVGGMDQLPRAIYRQLRSRVRFGAQVQAVTQDPGSVTVHYRTRAGVFSETADHVVCTVPLGLLRHLDFQPPLPRAKYRAIRQLNYNASTKIFLQVRHRFWESADGIVGGTTTTDLPIRRLVYPSHSDPEDERAVLLASYTWGQDAARWGALGPDERISLAIKDVAKIHPQIVDEVEGGASHVWQNDPWAGGAFALFEPGQETALHDDIVSAHGRIHFAGEHASVHHAWIEGAIESGLRAARAIDGSS